ncbi:sigma-70 family RNA polymerase sigma factor [Actinomadura graeca]|uniref:Sigma-70 family RNA polymerase sigma factor n=1 Tax=Actinomadura graeca TaxID=2750812 RepID=A0ABX8QYE1_9ACTN|nr:sigma-70 family RNA polymerase sigma factor [Actinomadura graeca]QXJ23194.1 sigma-70 family RNA polymerase sigma factor [Actinomadura graeca]
MDDQAELAAHFDGARGHLRAVAFRMLGSADEADDAVQETWLRASRAGAGGVANVTGWLTTIVGRVCLDLLRSRRRRGEEPADLAGLETLAGDAAGPEDEAVLADSVGLALLVVLDRLGPAERVAFVLHDLFAVPFAEIAGIVGRSPAAAKKLASRARARVHGTDPDAGGGTGHGTGGGTGHGRSAAAAADLARQREVVEAFLAASRAGDLDALLAVLAPDAVRRTDRAEVTELRGARRIAEETRTNAARARFARPALVDGAPGAVVAPLGRLQLVLRLRIDGGRVTAIDVVTDPGRLRALGLAVMPGPCGTP